MQCCLLSVISQDFIKSIQKKMTKCLRW